MGKKVCVDSNVLGWYVKGYATSGQEVYILKARLLFKKYQDDNVIIFIPSIVVAEVINDVSDPAKRDEILTFISENFEVGSFDIICSAEYATLFNEMSEKSFSTYRDENNVPKWKMKEDWMIAVEAKINNCSEIITHNKKDFKAFIGDYLPIFDLDEATSNFTTMESLFGEEDEEIKK